MTHSPPHVALPTNRQGRLHVARRSWVVVLALAVNSHIPAQAAAAEQPDSLPAAVQSEGMDFKPVGSGDLKLFGFRVYHASLWSSSGRYRPDEPLALNLLYHRDFSRAELVDITLSAWKKRGTGTDAQRNEWAGSLTRLWQDVRAGDTLTTVVIPGDETRFYNATGELGRIEDKEFGPAFLGIWLDEQTQLPELRTALLGLKRAS
jgi:Chalcone isomerase-like